ncbi:MAG TPA: Gfo/Idh/MocA family oxidoreductase [Candidatus Ornithospirochaeta avicola]|uniref:Gfo/Idh/MocA family oxidoreductase n=1 Tax=Candidatus Ornithospirochaeta avicola TaxID=2840896 RepID=A0A9D1PTV0_9SPIO|nr:Gfo/Idh/MocA family oxidoreductase [Candidatus Ornithospirochaeta avicola]
MEKTFKIGILGCGNIANTMARTISDLGAPYSLHAVASRSREKAEAFKEKYNAKLAYSSYKELCQDDEIDLVYIATITSEHKNHMMMALESGRNVLSEKAFTVNRREAEEVFALAEKKGLYAAEAIWTRYMPFRKTLLDYMKKIGKASSISASLGYKVEQKERIMRPELGGGAMLDLGVYPINFALMALEDEKITEVSGLSYNNDLGADITDTLLFKTESGVCVSITADSRTNSDRKAQIYGEYGYIETDNVNNPSRLDLYLFDNRSAVLDASKTFSHLSSGFEYEVAEARDMIEKGKTESISMPKSTTLSVLSLMDRAREIYGVKLGYEIT